MCVAIIKSWQMEKENMTKKQQVIPNVTTNSMAGIVSKELQGQKWWLNVQISVHVVQTPLPGWVTVILQWLKVESQRKSAFERLTSLKIVANDQSTLT